VSDMSVETAQSGIVERALACLHGGVGVQESNEDPVSGTSESTTGETVAVQVLTEYESPEAHLIVRAWRDITGTQLSPDRVREHLEMLRKWQGSWQRE